MATRPCLLGLLLLALATITPAQAAGPTEFYVDPDFTGSLQNGSAANPWTHLDSAPQGAMWTTINAALTSNDVAIYFSARSADRDANQISTSGVNLARTDKSSHRLTLDGMSRYNADDGRPRWSRYDGPSRLEIHYGYPISAYMPGTNQDHVAIRGFRAIGGFGGHGGQALVYWGGSHVLIENCEFLHAPEAKDGACVQFNYAWSERRDAPERRLHRYHHPRQPHPRHLRRRHLHRRLGEHRRSRDRQGTPGAFGSADRGQSHLQHGLARRRG